MKNMCTTLLLSSIIFKFLCIFYLPVVHLIILHIFFLTVRPNSRLLVMGIFHFRKIPGNITWNRIITTETTIIIQEEHLLLNSYFHFCFSIKQFLFIRGNFTLHFTIILQPVQFSNIDRFLFHSRFCFEQTFECQALNPIKLSSISIVLTIVSS